MTKIFRRANCGGFRWFRWGETKEKRAFAGRHENTKACLCFFVALLFKPLALWDEGRDVKPLSFGADADSLCPCCPPNKWRR